MEQRRHEHAEQIQFARLSFFAIQICVFRDGTVYSIKKANWKTGQLTLILLSKNDPSIN